jgi:hypothetical protein
MNTRQIDLTPTYHYAYAPDVSPEFQILFVGSRSASGSAKTDVLSSLMDATPNEWTVCHDTSQPTKRMNTTLQSKTVSQHYHFILPLHITLHLHIDRYILWDGSYPLFMVGSGGVLSGRKYYTYESYIWKIYGFRRRVKTDVFLLWNIPPRIQIHMWSSNNWVASPLGKMNGDSAHSLGF